MLVLSRKAGERIVIDVAGGITITIVETQPGKVRLGFTCDRSIVIHREEVYKAIQLEEQARARNQQRAASGPSTSTAPSDPPGAEGPASAGGKRP
jgi:carbon storage regulator CsrA